MAAMPYFFTPEQVAYQAMYAQYGYQQPQSDSSIWVTIGLVVTVGVVLSLVAMYYYYRVSGNSASSHTDGSGSGDINNVSGLQCTSDSVSGSTEQTCVGTESTAGQVENVVMSCTIVDGELKCTAPQVIPTQLMSVWVRTQSGGADYYTMNLDYVCPTGTTTENVTSIQGIVKPSSIGSQTSTMPLLKCKGITQELIPTGTPQALSSESGHNPFENRTVGICHYINSEIRVPGPLWAAFDKGSGKTEYLNLCVRSDGKLGKTN